MKFLVDHQLPPALARFICTLGHQAEHVRDVGLKGADDPAIWHHAATNGMVVISKDEDFTFLANAPGSPGRLIWVRMGNCRKRVLLEAFRIRLSQAVSLLEGGNCIVELR